MRSFSNKASGPIMRIWQCRGTRTEIFALLGRRLSKDAVVMAGDFPWQFLSEVSPIAFISPA